MRQAGSHADHGAGQESGPDEAPRSHQQRSRRRADGRSRSRHRHRNRESEKDGGGAGLRFGHRPENGGEPMLRRPDHGHQLFSIRRESDGPDHRAHAECEPRVLPAGGIQRHSGTGRPHDDRERIRRARRDWTWRAAGGLARRGDLQRRRQCDWGASSLPSPYTRPGSGRAGTESRCVMRPFEYVSPTTKAQAVSLLGASWGGTEILAGGTDLLALMKDDIVSPKRLVNIKNIRDLRGISSSPQGLRMGALTTLADLADDAGIKKNYPALAEAAIEAASPQIRNMATLAGNLCQRPRCWYFRNGFGLLPKNESGKDLVAEGDNRYHAILGNDGPAKFISPSTIVPALIAYGATIRLVGPNGRRELPLQKFFVDPRTENDREHDLRSNEIVTDVVIPHAGTLKAAHYEIRQKEAFDWPLAVAAVGLKMNGSAVQSARVILGSVAPIPWRSPEAEQVLAGKTVSEAVA